MKDLKNQVFKDAQVTVKDQAIQWEAFTIPLSGIARFWPGERPKEPQPSFFLLLLILLTAVGASFPGTVFSAAMALIILVIIGLCELKDTKIGVNIELSSGTVCTFVTEQEAFASEVCELIRARMSDREEPDTAVIWFIGEGKIEKEEKEEKSKKPRRIEPASQQSVSAQSGLAAADLMKLYEHEKEKESSDEQLLDLIEEILPLIEGSNRQEAKEKFAKIIEMGLIHECNELGLNALLEEIKACVY